MNKYINVEVAKEQLRIDAWDNPYFRSQACQQAINILDNIPAADVVEVRHGRWIVSATNLHFDSKCSACGETFYSPLKGAYIVHHAEYCPNCGAKMEGWEF